MAYRTAEKQQKRKLRHGRIRAHIRGTAKRPRVSVFRSNRYTHLQLIDDSAGTTLISVSDNNLPAKEQKKSKKDRAFALGKMLGKKAKEINITKVVFDRGGFKYHGRVKAAAEGLREAGIQM